MNGDTPVTVNPDTDSIISNDGAGYGTITVQSLVDNNPQFFIAQDGNGNNQLCTVNLGGSSSGVFLDANNNQYTCQTSDFVGGRPDNILR